MTTDLSPRSRRPQTATGQAGPHQGPRSAIDLAGPERPNTRAQELVGLMTRVQAGDQDAFRNLYDATITVAHATAFRSTRSAEHAAEVVQEVYLYAWQHAADYTPQRGSVFSWLLTLVQRRAVDRVRNVTRAATRDQRHFHQTSPTTPDVADLSLARHEAQTLRDALTRLSHKQRDALTLTYLHGYTTREAASLLAIPTGTLKTRVRDGITALRRHLTTQAA